MYRRNQSFKTVSIFLWSALLMFSPSSAQEAKIEQKDGVTIVHNPKEPVKKPGAPSSLELIRNLCIGDSPYDEKYMFSQIGGVMVDVDEDIIVIDQKEVVIRVYDRTGKHLRTFEKRGGRPRRVQYRFADLSQRRKGYRCIG